MNLEKNIYVYNRITLLYTWNIVNQLLESVCVLMDQLCLTLWDLMDCSLPGSSVHGILQARKLEWVAIPFSRGSSWPRDWILFSCIASKFFTIWATNQPISIKKKKKNSSPFNLGVLCPVFVLIVGTFKICKYHWSSICGFP